MKPVKINLLDNKCGPNPTKRCLRRSRTFYLFTFAIIFAGFFGLGRLSLSAGAEAALATLDGVPLLGQVRLIASPDRKLVGESDDRINILLLGMGGYGHDGPMLTDTIILASIRPSDNKVALLSIPRDLIVPLDNFGWRKINAANAYGEMQEKGNGPELARTTIENIFGIEIPYYVRIDFNGFKDIIDDVGGVELYVEKSFTDNSYPTEDYGYQVISFKEGWQQMDGDKALKYSRSRHGNNGEGSDFARAKRQQKVLMSLKEKLLSWQLLKDPTKISSLLKTLQANFKTNLQLGEILRLAKIGRVVDQSSISHQIISEGINEPLVSSTVGGAYVLVPRNDDWNGLRDIADNLLIEESDIVIKTPEPIKTVSDDDKKDPVHESDNVIIEVLNGTTIPGLAGKTASALERLGYQIDNIGNASDQTKSQTAIYNISGEDLKTDIEKIKDLLFAEQPKVVNSSNTQGEGSDTADILIILGQDMSEL